MHRAYFFMSQPRSQLTFRITVRLPLAGAPHGGPMLPAAPARPLWPFHEPNDNTIASLPVPVLGLQPVLGQLSPPLGQLSLTPLAGSSLHRLLPLRHLCSEVGSLDALFLQLNLLQGCALLLQLNFLQGCDTPRLFHPLCIFLPLANAPLRHRAWGGL